MFSKTAQYTFKILIFISKDANTLFSATHIHENIHIPYKYLTMLLTKLAKAEILKATRGRNGGFVLNKKASEIYLLEIVEAIEEKGFFNCALEDKTCNEQSPCPLHETFSPSKGAIEVMLKNTTLEQLNPNLLQ